MSYQLANAASPDYLRRMSDEWATQKESRARKLKEGWKRVEAFLDPETAKRWARWRKRYDDSPTQLVKAALDALEAANAKR